MFTPPPGSQPWWRVLYFTSMADRTFGVLQRVNGEIGRLSHTDIYDVTERILGLVVADIEKIQLYGPNPRRVDIKLVSRGVWNDRGLENHIEKDYVLL